MEQRYQAQNRTITKQYGPKVEAILSGLLVVAGSALLIMSALV